MKFLSVVRYPAGRVNCPHITAGVISTGICNRTRMSADCRRSLAGLRNVDEERLNGSLLRSKGSAR